MGQKREKQRPINKGKGGVLRGRACPDIQALKMGVVFLNDFLETGF
jgi:hypothetical protein